MRLITSILFSCAFVAGLSAQAVLVGMPTSVSLKFRLMAWGGDVPELAFGNNQKTEIIESGDQSAILDYAGPQQLAFTLFGTKTEKGAPPPVVVSATLPLGVSKVTLLTLPARGGRLGIQVIPEDGVDLPPKHARLYNFSGSPLRIIYNKSQRLELASGASALLAGEKDSIVVRVAAVVNGEWRELFNNVVETSAKEGRNVLLIKGFQGGGIGLYPMPVWPATPRPVVDGAAKE